jgi:hypothetical protein
MQSQEATQPTINVFSVGFKSFLICNFVHFCPYKPTIYLDQITGKSSEDGLFNIMRRMLALFSAGDVEDAQCFRVLNGQGAVDLGSAAQLSRISQQSTG